MGGDEAAAIVIVAAAIAACAASIGLAGAIARRMRQGMAIIAPRPQQPVPWSGRDMATVVALVIGSRLVAGAGLERSSSMHALLTANALAMLVGTALSIAYLRGQGASWAALGLSSGRVLDDLKLACAGLGLVLAPLLIAAAVLNQVVPYSHPIVDYLTTHHDTTAVALVVLSAVVAAPIAEEFLFRRVLQGWLQTKEPPLEDAAAVGISALVFAVAHYGQGLAWLPLFALGIVLGWIVRQTGSLLPAIVLHALFNAVSVALLLLQVRQAAAA